MKVEAQDMRGKRFVLSLKEWEARIFQHEFDHLQGTLYFDRMTPEVLSTIRHKLVVSLRANAVSSGDGERQQIFKFGASCFVVLLLCASARN